MENLDLPLSVPWSVGIVDGHSMSQFSRLLDEGFGLPAGKHFLDDFPIWTRCVHDQRVKVLGAFQKEKLIGAAGIRLGQVQNRQGMREPVALIGAVVTDASFQNQGLASRLVSLISDLAQKSGASLAVLWGSEASLYRKLGFDYCGQQCRIPLQSLALQSVRPVMIHRGWVPSLFQLIQTRSEGLILTEEDRPWFEAHRNVAWYYTGSAWQPTAYAALGRGIDLPGVVHEWGGEPSSLIPLLQQIRAENPEATLLSSPSLLTRFGVTPREDEVEFLCLAKKLTAQCIPLSSLWFWGLDSA